MARSGLITYMRTDSVALSGQAIGEAREVIGDRYGADYTMPKGRPFKTKTKQRPGGARGDPADVVPARPRGARARSWAATRPACTG